MLDRMMLWLAWIVGSSRGKFKVSASLRPHARAPRRGQAAAAPSAQPLHTMATWDLRLKHISFLILQIQHHSLTYKNNRLFLTTKPNLRVYEVPTRK